MENRVTNYQVREFYMDKDPYPIVTSAYMKTKYGQVRGGYINFAKLCSTKGTFSNPNKLESEMHLSSYNRMVEYFYENDNTYDLSFLNDVEDIPVLDIDVYGNDREPSQKWHLFVSLFAQSVVGDSGFKWHNNFKKYPCLQLKLWMAEEAGIDVKYILEAIDEKKEPKIVNQMIKNISWNDIFDKISK